MDKYRTTLILLAYVVGSCVSPPGELEEIPTNESTPLIAMQIGEQHVLPLLNQMTFELVNTEPIQMDFPGGEELREIGIVYHENQVYQAYVFAVNPNVSSGLYFAVSTDGVEWVVDPEPIDFPLANSKDSVVLNHLGPMVDGRWRLITTQWVTIPSGGGIEPEIWAMEADSLEGPWVLNEEPLLMAGESGRWDQSGTRFSALYSDDDLYYMLYFSSDPSFQGLAISDDGISWQRTLPEDVIGPYPEEGNIVFTERYDGLIYPYIVWRTPAGWQMINYFSQEPGDPSAGLRSAISSDGVSWESIDVGFLFENPHDNLEPDIITPFWVDDQLYLAYCLWVYSEKECYISRLVESETE